MVLTDRETVLLMAVLAVYVGGVVGLARTLPRVLARGAGWRTDAERHPVSGAVVVTVLIAAWPVSMVYLAWRVVGRRRW